MLKYGFFVYPVVSVVLMIINERGSVSYIVGFVLLTLCSLGFAYDRYCDYRDGRL